jgi:hypothetical protein
MGLQKTVQDGVEIAFNAIGDLAKPGVYKHRKGAIVRDIENGTSAPEEVSYPLKKIALVRFKAKEAEKIGAMATDMKMLFPARHLPIEAEASDVITVRGRTWEIISVMGDPADSIWQLQVRVT